MGGWKDLVALLLRWKSRPLVATPPYRMAAGQTWSSGQNEGRIRLAGQVTGRQYVMGQTAGAIHA